MGCCKTEADFPWTLVLVSATFRLLFSLSGTLIFPFVPFMLVDFGIPEEEVGPWAGAMASCFFLAQIPAGTFWGWLSDKVGRQPVVAIGLLGQAASLLLMGLSRNAAQCMGSRVLGGLLAGAEPAIVAALRERTPKRHRTRAFTYSQAGFSGGVLLGPVMGGLLSKPAESFPALEGSIFDAHPYLLSCAVAATCQLSGVFLVRFMSRKRKTLGSQDAAATELPDATLEATAAAAAPSPAAAMPSQPSWIRSSLRRFARGVRAVCASGTIAVCLTDIFLMHAVQSSLAELFPLYASNQQHGLALRPVQVGESLMPMGFTLFVVAISMGQLEKCIGLKVLFRFGMSLFGSLIVGIPTVLPALRAVSPGLLWAGLLVLGFTRPAAGMLSMSAMNIMYNNAIKSDFGFYNGIAASTTSTGRCLFPVFSGSLFSLGVSSADTVPFPLGVYLPFNVAGALAALAVTISFWLPAEVGLKNGQRGGEEPEARTSSTTSDDSAAAAAAADAPAKP